MKKLDKALTLGGAIAAGILFSLPTYNHPPMAADLNADGLADVIGVDRLQLLGVPMNPRVYEVYVQQPDGSYASLKDHLDTQSLSAADRESESDSIWGVARDLLEAKLSENNSPTP